MRSKTTVRLSLLSLLPFLYAPALAEVIHVPADQPTIQAGIDAASDGDPLFVTGPLGGFYLGLTDGASVAAGRF